MKNNPYNRRGKSQGNTSVLGDAIGQLLESYNIREKFDQTELIVSWEKLMGRAIASRTDKIYIKEKVMYIKLLSAPLKHELNLSKSKIMDIINNEHGDGIVEKIVLL